MGTERGRWIEARGRQEAVGPGGRSGLFQKLAARNMFPSCRSTAGLAGGRQAALRECYK